MGNSMKFWSWFTTTQNDNRTGKLCPSCETILEDKVNLWSGASFQGSPLEMEVNLQAVLQTPQAWRQSEHGGWVSSGPPQVLCRATA